MFFFASNQSGWMTEDMFILWSLFVLVHASLYRQRFLIEQNEKIYLFVGGHGSHASQFQILAQANIRVITLLAPTSHICQMFDLVLAYPLKHNFKIFYKAKLGEARRQTQNESTAQRMPIINTTVSA